VTYVITEPCIDVKDRSCIEECPVDCIYEGDRMLYIHSDECVDCGACEPVCPVEAIFYEDDVPAQWKDFTAANAAFFTEGEEPLGSPGGAANVGPPGARRRLRRQLPAPRQLAAQPTSMAERCPSRTKASAAEARTAPGRVASGRCRLGAGRSGRW
jgi:NAD-dependent dihydropyrimidine dehydrogenase PreA subunit